MGKNDCAASAPWKLAGSRPLPYEVCAACCQPREEGNYLPLPQAYQQGAQLRLHVVIFHLLCRLLHRSRCHMILILLILFEISSSRVEAVLGGAAFPKEFSYPAGRLMASQPYRSKAWSLAKLQKVQVGESSFTGDFSCDLGHSFCSCWSKEMPVRRGYVLLKLSPWFCWEHVLSDRKTCLLLTVSVCVVPLNFKCTYIQAQMFLMHYYYAAEKAEHCSSVICSSIQVRSCHFLLGFPLYLCYVLAKEGICHVCLGSIESSVSQTCFICCS